MSPRVCYVVALSLGCDPHRARVLTEAHDRDHDRSRGQGLCDGLAQRLACRPGGQENESLVARSLVRRSHRSTHRQDRRYANCHASSSTINPSSTQMTVEVSSEQPLFLAVLSQYATGRTTGIMMDSSDISSVSLLSLCASGRQTGIVRDCGNVTLFLTQLDSASR